MVIEKNCTPAETAYRAWCRDCFRFVADTWDPVSAELAATDHRNRPRNRHHYIVMRTDTVAADFSGTEGID